MLSDGEKGVVLQRDRETFAITPHIQCGVITPDILRKIADVAEKYEAKALKITSEARIAIIGLQAEDIDSAWADLGMEPAAAVGLCVRSIKACPGTTYCKRGQQDSLSMGIYLDTMYNRLALPGKVKIGVAGCGNKCAEVPIKDLGLVGSQQGWDVYVGGCGGGMPRLADCIAKGLDDATAKDFIADIIAYYTENARRHERMGRFIKRIGLAEFKSGVKAERYG